MHALSIKYPPHTHHHWVCLPVGFEGLGLVVGFEGLGLVMGFEGLGLGLVVEFEGLGLGLVVGFEGLGLGLIVEFEGLGLGLVVGFEGLGLGLGWWGGRGRVCLLLHFPWLARCRCWLVQACVPTLVAVLWSL